MQHIIRLTLKEILNKRILHLGLILTIIYLLVYYWGIQSTLKTAPVMVQQQLGYQFMTLGWYMSTFLVGSIAIMAGIGSISGEVESGTMLSLVSKPLSRRSIVLGKFLAYTLITALYSALLAGAVSFIAQHFFALVMDPVSLINGILLFMLFPVILLAVAHLGSVLMSTLATGISAFILFTVGIIGGFIEQLGAMMGNGSMVNIGVVSSLLIPCDAVYRMAVSQAGGVLGQASMIAFGPFGTASVPSIWMLIYAFLYVAVMLGLAVYFFANKDL